MQRRRDPEHRQIPRAFHDRQFRALDLRASAACPSSRERKIRHPFPRLLRRLRIQYRLRARLSVTFHVCVSSKVGISARSSTYVTSTPFAPGFQPRVVVHAQVPHGMPEAPPATKQNRKAAAGPGTSHLIQAYETCRYSDSRSDRIRKPYVTVVFSTPTDMNFDRTHRASDRPHILKPEATRAEVQQVCAEALQFEFASVCVNSFWVPLVAAELQRLAA